MAARTPWPNRFRPGHPSRRCRGCSASYGTRGWRLAILSNTDPDLLATSVAAIGVPFDALITAGEAGSYKPAPGHWERFFADTGAARGHHVHVAASLFHDIEPAAADGTHGRVDQSPRRVERHPPGGRAPDLGGLPRVLDELA